MATTQVSNITEFLAACADTSCTKIELTADIDFTTISSYPINIGSSCTEIDGGGHSFNNIACINANGIFKHLQTSMIQFIYKNLNFNMMYVFNTSSNSNSAFSVDNFSYGNSSASFLNCDIKFKVYLANKTPVNGSSYYNVFYGFKIYEMISCNISYDIYLITASNNLQCLFTADTSNHGYGLKDSILKINIYDPMGWGRKVSTVFGGSSMGGIFGSFVSINNCGIFVNYKSDVDMIKDDTKKILRIGSQQSSYYNSYTSNSYFIYENTGNVKLTPTFYNLYFLTYSFYDKDKATWNFDSCSYHLGQSQVMGLTTTQCKSRSTFEGPTAILPFKLKQDVEP